MKHLLFLFFFLSLVSCVEEGLTITEYDDTEAVALDAQLATWVQSVASHDGSYDDVIDHSPCFSINFPYVLQVNGYKRYIESEADLGSLHETDSISVEFPVTMTLFDFSEYICPSQYYLQEYIGRCDNGELFGEQITCVDLLYPIQLGVYDQTTSYFETITLNHDFDTYTHMGALEPGILMSINYPIQAIVEGESPVTIHDNDELRAQIYRIIPICE